MVLCVDIGNSYVKYAVADGNRWIDLGMRDTRRAASGWTSEIARHRPRLRQVTGSIVSSVVPSLNRPLARRLTELTGRRPSFVDHRFVFPFELRVTQPQKVGVDRLCAASGACRHGARSAIVVDVGSAITVDLVDGGAYLGGLIMTGPSLALSALADHTAKLPRIAFGTARSVRRTANGTQRSMIEGARVATIGALREAVRTLKRRAGGRPVVHLTGGGVAGLHAQLPTSWRYDADLVIRGLYQVWKLNAPSRRQPL